MKLLLLGKGKMGALLEEVARERGHSTASHDEFDNPHACALTPEHLREFDAAVDFTVPDAVLENIAACARGGLPIVVGTTGWYGQIPRVKELVEKSGIGLLYAANFSIGVHIFMQIARTAAAALKQGYSGQIMERHHVHKKDAPSGTAVKLQGVLEDAGGQKLEITSIREGEVVGMHVVLLDSPNDTIMLTHDAKSRRGFAEGAIRAAEWLAGKKGFYEFKDVVAKL
jgi:4-hydroxy-tetrahydrodipicolinate reductase